VRVFLDENMPRALRNDLRGHEVASVEDKNWKGRQNGELLSLVEREFDVFLTADAGITHQNLLEDREVSVVIFPTNRWTLLKANVAAVQITLDEIEQHPRHVLIVVHWDGRRTLRRLDQMDAGDLELTRVAPFSPGGSE
jgi:hypothetical protein